MPTVPGGLFDDPTLPASQAALTSRFLDLLTLNEIDLNVFNLRGQSNFEIDDTFENTVLFNGPDETLNVTVTDTGGAAIIMGGDGRFTLTAGTGGDSLLGGEAADSIEAGLGDDLIFGGDANDTLTAADGANVIYGNLGADSIVTGLGSDTLFGGGGNDVLNPGAAADIVFGNKGDDTIEGLQGADVLYGNQDADSIAGGDEADTLFGGQGNDTLAGGAGNDVMFGNRDDDTFQILSAAGDDTIFGFQLGDDVIAIANNINASGITTEGDLLGRITNDANGNAVIDLDGGDELTVVGFSATDLIANINDAVDIV